MPSCGLVSWLTGLQQLDRCDDGMIPVVDLFAGPGGLNEGFTSVRNAEGGAVFRTVASFEMEAHAHETLTMRAVFRKLQDWGEDEPYYEFVRGQRTLASFRGEPTVAKAYEEAEAECHQIRLGPETRPQTEQLIARALRRGTEHSASEWVLIGGPPCQAYSLAGRSRRIHDLAFEDDEKHFLFREYLEIIRKFRPSIFVMENVKGLLSSKHKGQRMFQTILGDLSRPSADLGYEIRSLAVPPGLVSAIAPTDFVIRAERYGVPQRRHRVILLGVRRDLAERMSPRLLTPQRRELSVRDAIEDLPAIRSGISPARNDNYDAWLATARKAQDLAADALGGSRRQVRDGLGRGMPYQRARRAGPKNRALRRWVYDPRLGGNLHHETRGHMTDDLLRYGYLARLAEVRGESVTLPALPPELRPRHANVGRPDTPFLDRFRVQLWGHPSTTVVSHISKDGHYYIHPDPTQMRSLTVREAARLQTFPDNYYFMGTRTQQYHQVGNAVPPLLAHQIGNVLRDMLMDSEARSATDGRCGRSCGPN